MTQGSKQLKRVKILHHHLVYYTLSSHLQDRYYRHKNRSKMARTMTVIRVELEIINHATFCLMQRRTIWTCIAQISLTVSPSGVLSIKHASCTCYPPCLPPKWTLWPTAC
eukprot:TRINITY_DN1029_c0_g1::TRINITY_DN1029_c0_g1_i1::g.30012::m.30012 TRINITY_DN1029_c0_g1::TRINITY_DN1029_c0_g1_i1::g.30012  ORF type:complete len:110 (-),score=-10.40,DUF4050/PF13259.1/0.11 TRINITY_DN1029_c0_g1_i1:1230-1559(-)